MRLVVQRALSGSVEVAGQICGRIDAGLVVLVGIHAEDEDQDISFCADKCVHLRIFDDEDGRMNRSILDTGGQMLAISQFTLYGDCRKGRRPSYDAAARPEHAKPLYEQFVDRVASHGVHVECGVFGSYMKVSLENDGPVTLIIESPEK
ncbi:MAG: D-tyrosyl-tRNA(Tyr) deacylase [Gemmatimonadetes bacterium]|nr:D-tyrosyl-tRNA(Tyr) deacylase [Gemmatimonadota bacterium]MBT7860466.1 D-tyrosyl-tRNA(Tyr) deacylase [Gemmatimonadota bacterium]